jgi:hypothetical protein
MWGGPAVSGISTGKPALVIDSRAAEGNVFALVAKARITLEEAGRVDHAEALGTWFSTLPRYGFGVSYKDVRRMVEQVLRRHLAERAPFDGEVTGVAEPGHPYLIRYDYVGSGEPQRCGFICTAVNGRAAAENFANQHPGLWFQLVSVSSGGDEPFWLGGTTETAEQGHPYLVTYTYTESGATQRCGFVCHATNVRAAAEKF